jgi:predicted transcriptional regulator
MKTAISIPDDVFQAADRLAKRLKKSRSQLYAEAVADYTARHTEDEITESWNRALEGRGDEETDAFVTEASRRILERTEWQ